MVFKEVHGFEVHGLQGTDRKNSEIAPYTHPLSVVLLLRCICCSGCGHCCRKTRLFLCMEDWELSGVLRT
jgi:hypothetical protein